MQSAMWFAVSCFLKCMAFLISKFRCEEGLTGYYHITIRIWNFSELNFHYRTLARLPEIKILKSVNVKLVSVHLVVDIFQLTLGPLRGKEEEPGTVRWPPHFVGPLGSRIITAEEPQYLQGHQGEGDRNGPPEIVRELLWLERAGQTGSLKRYPVKLCTINSCVTCCC